eukprot:5329938-Amphidinium_carterae.1
MEYGNSALEYGNSALDAFKDICIAPFPVVRMKLLHTMNNQQKTRAHSEYNQMSPRLYVFQGPPDKHTYINLLSEHSRCGQL